MGGYIPADLKAPDYWDNYYAQLEKARNTFYPQVNLAKRRELIRSKATVTEAPCGVHSCWEAGGLACHCSCGGLNHGIAHDPERQEEYQKLLNGGNNDNHRIVLEAGASDK